ncbi:hypothetical protein ACPCG0_07530 [Propionibacteriaceae bacterium Y1923]
MPREFGSGAGSNFGQRAVPPEPVAEVDGHRIGPAQRCLQHPLGDLVGRACIIVVVIVVPPVSRGFGSW